MVKVKFEYKILISYLLIGGLWISFSDQLAKKIISDPNYLTEIQTYKGWFYVLVTGILFYFLLKKHLIKIRNAEKKARESDQLKTAFLQNISHEIRTPMNGIVGFAGLLKENDLTKDQKEMYLDIITKSSDQLLNVVNDVLDVSLIDSGNVIINKTQFNLNEFLEQIYSVHSTILRKNISLRLNNTLYSSDHIVFSDSVKLGQILDNLISNAIKYTPKGEVELGCETKENKLLFSVKDSGIGIAPEYHEKIFDRFHRAEIETTKTIGGAGLGLAICRGNVNLLGGDIWVESNLGIGSKFYFTIPGDFVVQKPTVEEKADSKSVLRPGCVLVAEDEEYNFLYISRILNDAGIDFLRAKNGQEAVDICRKNANLGLILMDIKMPVLNGYEAVKIIREFRNEIPIIAQTAFAIGNEKKKALDVGCNDYIAKPFKREELLNKIRENTKAITDL
ncbi:hybrid sensor histidine kinase/response regulator [Labilibaculum euxinus]|uniref:histidine kinase n=1 Tax=Labilibaculum euxinus TaxID=2686357 RepID=A0A7M4D555_9BACT|nr:ATP-binding protein [Labilibaculum euxinus]MUP37784.1 response regulator [Labilibaculum euxinus]MVB06989.1 response regulator [Labilibaculum euxinus]